MQVQVIDNRSPMMQAPFYADGVTAEMINKGGYHYHKQTAYYLRNRAAALRAQGNVMGNAAALEEDSRHAEALAANFA